MSRHWFIVVAGILIAAAVGFQQAEPLEDLRRYGSLAQGVGGLKADEYLFMPDEKNVSGFVDSLAVVARCRSVRGLFVPRTDNLHEALTRVAKIQHLSRLRMRGTDVNEDDLAVLAGMKNLQDLDLSQNPTVTDAGIAALSGLENLRVLDLTSTSVTGTGLTPWTDFRDALRDIQYSGSIVIESFTPDNRDLAGAVCIWKRFTANQDEFASRGLDFLRELFI